MAGIFQFENQPSDAVKIRPDADIIWRTGYFADVLNVTDDILKRGIRGARYKIVVKDHHDNASIFNL